MSQTPQFWVFLGSTPWADPAAALLNVGERRKRAGWDVVLAGVVPEAKPTWAVQAASFEQAPLRHHADGDEVDIDALIARRPDLVLLLDVVAPQPSGARHPQRFLLIRELLAAGIAVYTSLFIGQVASRMDLVQAIIEQAPLERHWLLPDSVLDQAHHIELVEPDSLENQDPDRAQRGAALRVLTLRCISEQIDQRLQAAQQLKYILGTGQATERLLTAVSASPFSERLLRWTRRLAFNLEAKWYAVNIQPSHPLPPAAQQQLDQNLNLARQLGAEVLVVPGDDLVANLLRVAHERDAKHIVVGKSIPTSWRDWLPGQSLADRLIARSGDVDIFVVSAHKSEQAPELWRVPRPAMRLHDWLWLGGTAAVFSIAGLSTYYQWIEHELLSLLLLVISCVAALRLRSYWLVGVVLGGAVLWGVTGLSAGRTVEGGWLLHWVMYMVVASALSYLTAYFATRQQYHHLRENRLSALSNLSRRMASATDLDAVLLVAREQILSAFGCAVAVFLVAPNGQLDAQPHPASSWAATDPNKQAVLAWVQTRQRSAGLFTRNYPSAKARYYPLLASGSFVGVLAAALDPAQAFPAEQRTLLQEFNDRIAYAIQRERLLAAKQQAELLERSEKLFSTLLDSVSHELRTPLATIGSAANLLLTERQLPLATRQTLGSDLGQSVTRLNRLVDNLLDMSRLESGHLELRLEWCDLHELLLVTHRQLQQQLSHHRVVQQLPAGFIWVRIDFKLFSEVLYNLLLNACTYTPSGSTITIVAEQSPAGTDLRICDDGPGLADPQAVFQKFYRGESPRGSGMGLGLAICRGYIEAHKGQLAAYNQAAGGACFHIHLPYEQPPSLPADENTTVLPPTASASDTHLAHPAT